jgi:hypothetical protein
MRAYIAPISLAIVVMVVALYFFVLEAKLTPNLNNNSENVALDSETIKHFSSIAEKFASEASEVTKK